MNYILGLSGRKQSGKNTTANFLLGLVMKGIGLIQKEFVMSDEGKLWISDLLGDEGCAGIFDYYRRNDHIENFKDEYIHPFVKLYSYADLLKQEVCMKVLGLTYEQCYGTDDDKNTETRYRWEDMPGVITPNTILDYIGFETSSGFSIVDELEIKDDDPKSKDGHESAWCGYIEEKLRTEPHIFNSRQWIDGLVCHQPGIMTARDIMQYVGTDIFRRMYGDVWVNATINQIKADNSGFAIITDVRFPNEVDGIHNAGGKVMRFTRDPFKGADCHESETTLDKDKYDWDKFDWVIDNADCSVLQQCNLCQQALMDSRWLEQIEEPTK